MHAAGSGAQAPCRPELTCHPLGLAPQPRRPGPCPQGSAHASHLPLPTCAAQSPLARAAHRNGHPWGSAARLSSPRLGVSAAQHAGQLTADRCPVSSPSLPVGLAAHLHGLVVTFLDPRL